MGQMNGLGADAGDIDAELDHIHAQANDTDTRLDTAETDITAAEADITTLQGEMTTAQGDITTLQTDLGTAQTDIAALQAAALDGQTRLTGSANLSTITTGQILFNSAGATLTLNDPSSRTVGQRFLVMCRTSGGPCYISSAYNAPDNDEDVQLRDGDAAMITVVDDVAYAGTKRYSVVMLPASHQYNKTMTRSTSKVFTKADMPRTVHVTASSALITLPAIEDQMVDRDITICNHSSGTITISATGSDDISGNGTDSTTYVLSGNTNLTLRASPDLGSSSYNWCII